MPPLVGRILVDDETEMVIMLNLTSRAATEIRNLANRSNRPDTAGLRITSDFPGSIKLSLVPAPEGDDSVVDASGARVFLDQQAAGVLDDKILDATTDNDGRAHFAIATQSE